MTWAEQANELAAAAERARLAGDVVASIVLAIKAAECAQISRLLAPNTEDLP
jgi:hypothetical protein